MNPLRRPVLSGLTLLALMILLSLGTWQVQRLQWKTQLIAETTARLSAPPQPLTQLDETLADYTTVIVKGHFTEHRPAFVAGMHEGAPGWFAFHMFDIEGASSILLNRGFIPYEDYLAGNIDLPVGGETHVTALIRHYVEPGWIAKMFIAPPSLDRGEFYTREKAVLFSFFADKAVKQRLMADFYLEAWPKEESVETPPFAGATRVEFSNRHFGYVVTWYGLAVALIGVYTLHMRQSLRRDADT